MREELERTLALARTQPDPFDAALFMLIALPYLQAFVDGNKRTARLLTNLPLFEQNVRPLSFVDVEREDYLRATLCTYEFREPGPMKELFVHAYVRSCARYPEVLDVVPNPDPFRLEHRARIYEVVRDVVVEQDTSPRARIEAYASEAFEEVSAFAKFVAIVLTDLDALHEGNFMRYRISPAQFEAWSALESER